jgi:hypothetical protein
LDDASEYARRVSTILSKKTDTEYGSTGLTLVDTEGVITQSRRLVKRALGHVPRRTETVQGLSLGGDRWAQRSLQPACQSTFRFASECRTILGANP